MPEHISDQLNAYMDGELEERAQGKVMAHLESCPACRKTLEELQQVARLLQAAPLPGFTPAEAFSERLMQQLPSREDAQPEAPGTASSLLWLAPAITLAGWLFMQATYNLSGLVAWVSRAGVMEGALAWAAGSPQQTRWFAATQAALEGLLGLQMPAGLNILNAAGVFANSLAAPLLWQAAAAAFYWAALTLILRNRSKSWQASSKAG